jgi:hypothetical protein
MAAFEMYDFLSDAVPDVEQTLTVDPQEIIFEEGEKAIEQHEGDDNSEESIILSTSTVFYVTLIWKNISQSDAGTIFNFYHSADYGCGTAKSFWWTPPSSYDGHTYVVKFRGPLKRAYFPRLRYACPSVVLRIIGRKPD